MAIYCKNYTEYIKALHGQSKDFVWSSSGGTYSYHSALGCLKYEKNFTILFHECESWPLVQRDEHWMRKMRIFVTKRKHVAR
jgi:hypothetical protein